MPPMACGRCLPQVPASSIAGRVPALKRCALALVLVLASAAVTAQAAFTIQELMRTLAGASEAVTQFTETRSSSALKTPLVTTGELRYTRPGRLERHVRTPREERYIVEGDTVTILRAGSAPRTISLSSHPALAGFLDTLRATLRGDLAALERTYRVELSGDRAHWRMTLLPADPQLAELVTAIRVSGSGGRLTEMEMVEASGDRVVTQFAGAGP
jgi:outer membrane lipoprotein-sorting protein